MSTDCIETCSKTTRQQNEMTVEEAQKKFAEMDA